MKKTFFLSLTLLLVLLLGVFTLSSCKLGNSKELSYELSDDGTYYTVIGLGTCTDTELVIPDTYKGLPVKAIGYPAFYNCDSLTSVVIPDSVTSIGVYAFYDCDNLTSVGIPDSVTSIGNHAFENCSNLTSVEVDENNEYYKDIDGNLYTKDSKTLIQYAIGKTDASFIIPDSVTSIGEWAFSDCSSLTSVVIPDSVEIIGDYAFYYCSSLTSIVIPDSVEIIGDSAFSSCSSLTSVVIPDSVASIGNSAFRDCSSLTSVEVDENNEYYKDIDGNLYTKDGETLIQYAVGKTDTSFTLPDSVKLIGDHAFSYCSRLTSVVIPDSVTSIGIYAFRDCSSLTSVVIGNGVEIIGNGAFAYCKSLTSVEFKDTSTWYCTNNEDYTGGTEIDVTDTAANAEYFRSYYSRYWYKK